MLRPGRWFAVYVVGYGLGRLWVESLRIDFATTVLGFRVNTWISLLAIAGGLLWLFWGGSPVDRTATDQLRAGQDPLARAAVRSPKGHPDGNDPGQDTPTDGSADVAGAAEDGVAGTSAQDDP